MGEANLRGFRIFFQVITSILFLGFLSTAVGGIVMKTSTSALQAIVTMAIKEYKGDADDLRQVAAFLLGIADTTALYCIVVGVALAVLALIGLIASCCGWHKVLKIYIAILIILLVAQIIIVAVLFSNPIKFANNIVSSMETLLKSYGDKSEEGDTSTTIWNALMKTDPTCCGMDGYKDFGITRLACDALDLRF
ncbi:unnamed protein product [Taenia asiatica]|uniref:Tetraspanin n=1 Tax=Taenia asiatica TaxID=60517 RepID=A0A0R3VTD3_TAEAS|nr:unnamed protein product [Taenia asiatica]